jgi:hypothetical protein
MTSLWSLKVLTAIALVLYAGSYLAFRQSSTEIWERDKCPDSEVRKDLLHALMRTSESRDTSNSMIPVPL